MENLPTDKPFVILGEPVNAGQDPHSYQLSIQEETRKYLSFRYTTSFDALTKILTKHTFRSTSLDAAKINDKMEKQRGGVEAFAHNKFITCFTHDNHESVPFWCCYGLSGKENKVQLKFKNFSDIEAYIETDYALIDGSKIFFKSPEYFRTINNNGIPGQMVGLQPIHTDYDTKICIDSLAFFNVEYVPVDDEIFSKEYSETANIDFGKYGVPTEIRMKLYNPTTLGKQKSNPWDYEKETRILLTVNGQVNPATTWIDLRLKPEIFRDMEIIMGPWCEDNFYMRIKTAIDESGLPDDIRESIVILESSLHGTLNME